jgi:hypothetical protein
MRTRDANKQHGAVPVCAPLGAQAVRKLVAPGGAGDTDATVSREEALRRERQRMTSEGINVFKWWVVVARARARVRSPR